MMLTEVNHILNRRVYQVFLSKIEAGYGFVVSHRFEGISSGSVIEIFAENPSDSGRVVYVIAAEVVSSGYAYIDIYRNNTLVSSGTQLTPANLNFASAITSPCIINYGGTYTAGMLVHSTLNVGGSKNFAVGGLAEVGESVVIPPGGNILLRVTNKADTTADISVRFLWFENKI